MSILGLDIGSRYIKAVVANGLTRSVKRAYVIETPQHAVKDGELKDVQAVAGAVRNLIDSKRLRIRELYIAVKSPQLTNREIKLPKLRQEEIHSAIEFDLSQVFPNIQQSNTISHIQYTKPGAPFVGLAVFCPTKILDGYMKLAEALNMPLYRIDTGFNASVRAAEYYGLIKHTPDTTIFLDVGIENSQITIVTGGRIVLSRHIAFGAGAAAPSLTDPFADSTEKENGLPVDFSPLIEQLNQTLDYFKYTRTEEPRITRVFLTGTGSRNEELVSLLEEKLALPVKHPELNLKGFDRKNSAVLYLAAIGVLLRKPKRFADVNLLPDFRLLTREKAYKKRQTVAVAFVAFFAILFSIAYGMLQYQELLVQQDAESLEQRMAVYSEVNSIKRDIAAAQGSIDNIGAILETADKSAAKNTKILEGIMSAMPKGVFIQSYSASSGTVSMAGIAKTRPDIAEYIYRLRSSGIFGSVTVGSISPRLDKDGKETDYSFNINASLAAD
jgi:type IV pilus assembly protein PilM